MFWSSESTSIPTNPRTTRPVGYAFVDLTTSEEAERAITELSGKEIRERKVSVQRARKPETAAEKAEAAASGGEGVSGGEGGRRRNSGRGRGRGRGRGGRSGRGGGRSVSITVTSQRHYFETDIYFDSSVKTMPTVPLMLPRKHLQLHWPTSLMWPPPNPPK